MRFSFVLFIVLCCFGGVALASDVWVEKTTGMVFIKIPGGCYVKGCLKKDNMCYYDEKPSKRVCVKDFWISKYEVTVSQWKQFVKESGYIPEKKDMWGCVDTAKPMFEQEGDHPVVCVNWYDAEAFVKWLSKKTGFPVRLPTEDEWEYVCKRGGGVYSTGDKISGDLANYWSGFSGKSGRDVYKYTSPVGHFGCNNLGVCDLSGNAWEWVSDWYSAPSLPDRRDRKVVKGGGWSDKAKFLRCSARRGLYPDRNYDTVGFRVVVDKVEEAR